MSVINLFRELDERIRKSYDLLDIKCLDEYEIENETSLIYWTKCTAKKNYDKQPKYSILKLYHDLKFISQEIKYTTALLYLLRPYIINTITTRGQYIQNNEDHRFLQFANFGVQSVYNFWDRLGDLLDIFFKTGLRDDSIYLSRVLNNLNDNWKNAKPFKDLNALYKRELNENILGMRSELVHNFQLECRYYWGNVEASGQPEKIKELTKEKMAYPEKMKTALENCNLAFKYTLALIAELPDQLDSSLN